MTMRLQRPKHCWRRTLQLLREIPNSNLRGSDATASEQTIPAEDSEPHKGGSGKARKKARNRRGFQRHLQRCS